MKKTLVIFVILIVASFVPSASKADLNKMDGFLRITESDPYIGKAVLGKAMSLEDVDVPTVDCLVKSLDPEITSQNIEEVGGKTKAVIGQIMSVTIPVDSLYDISESEEIIYMEAAKPMAAKMNEARNYTGVASVQAGTGLTQAYNGRNVLVGVVDGAINWSHADFLGSDQTTRICYMQERTSSGSTLQCTKSTIDDDSCSISDSGSADYGHGTHVTGIAAGANATYKGVAPQSFIAFAFNAATNADPSDPSSTSFSTTVLEDVSAIFTKATSLDMPSVINLSLGTSLGAHDNTSLLEEGLNSAVSGQQGRIIVNAAGNENVNYESGISTDLGGIHAPINVSAESSNGWKVAIFNTAISAYSNYAVADIWLANTDECRAAQLQVMAYRHDVAGEYNAANANLKTTQIDFSSDQTSLDKQTPDGKVGVDVYTYTQNTQNDRPNALVLIGPTTTGSWTDITNSTTGYYFDIIIRGTIGSCAGDMWLYPDQTAIVDFFQIFSPNMVVGADGYQLADGDSNKTMTIPGTASGVIAVGSYMDRGTWTDMNGNVQSQTEYNSSTGGTGGTAGDISLFSSLGPTGEEGTSYRIKPDLVAPGEPIISTLASGSSAFYSSVVKGDSTHLKLEGTSMSSPHVAGIVALLLEKNNCLTTSDVWTALTTTATPVRVSSTSPNNTYGYGKVNALAAIQTISANSSCYSGTTCGSGGGSSGGCGSSGSTIAPIKPSLNIYAVLLLLLPALLISILRVRSRLSSRT